MKNNVKYVDGFVLVVPTKKLKEYEAMAKGGAKLWMKHGALDYKECVADDLAHDMMGGDVLLPFPSMAKAKAGETVVFSYIGYKSRAHRDAVNKKVLKEIQALAEKDPKSVNMAMPFDPKRMAYGGFKVLVDGK